MDVQLLQATHDHFRVMVSTRVEDVKIREGLQGVSVTLTGGGPSGEIGGPDLPQITFEVALPAGKAVGKVDVEHRGGHHCARAGAPAAGSATSAGSVPPARPEIEG
jgi:hypothetical protein